MLRLLNSFAYVVPEFRAAWASSRALAGLNVRDPCLKMAGCQLINGSRTLSATNPGKSPGASRAKFRDDSHWETYLKDAEVVKLVAEMYAHSISTFVASCLMPKTSQCDLVHITAPFLYKF